MEDLFGDWKPYSGRMSGCLLSFNAHYDKLESWCKLLVEFAAQTLHDVHVAHDKKAYFDEDM